MRIQLDPNKQRELERHLYFLHNDLAKNKDDLELYRFIEMSIQCFETAFGVEIDISKPPPILTKEDEGEGKTSEFLDEDVAGPSNVKATEKKGTKVPLKKTAMINVKTNSKTTLKKDVKATGKTDDKATLKKDVKAPIKKPITTNLKKDDKAVIKKTDNKTEKKGGPTNTNKNKKENQKEDDDDPDDDFFKTPDYIPRGMPKAGRHGVHRGEQYNFKANDFILKGKYQQALAHYTKAIGMNTKEPMYFYNRGITHFHLGDYEKCIEDCSEANRLDRCYSKSHACAGKAYYLANQMKSAARCFTLALRLEPTNVSFQKHFKLVQAKLVEELDREKEAAAAKPQKKAAISPVKAKTAKPQIKPVVEYESESSEEQYAEEEEEYEGEGEYEEEEEYDE